MQHANRAHVIVGDPPELPYGRAGENSGHDDPTSAASAASGGYGSGGAA